MAWIVWTILFALAVPACLVGGWLLKRHATSLRGGTPRDESEADYWHQWGVGLKWTGRVLAAGWVLLTVFGFSMQTVESGAVGITRTFGKIDGQVGSGVNFIAPWQTFETQNVKVQHYVFADTNCNENGQCDRKDRLTAASKDTQDVFIDATLNYSLSAEKVQELLSNVGANWFQTLVYPRVVNDVKEQTVKYEATDILVHREVIRQATKDALTLELQPYSINVQDFLINNVDFQADFKAAVEAKQAAVQHAAQATNDATAAVNTAQGAADAKVRQSQGDAQATKNAADAAAYATKVQADAQAAANAELVQSLGGSDAFIANQNAIAAQHWNVTTYAPGSNGGVIVNGK